MKLAVLFSGGKDSTYALYKAGREHEIACLLSVYSENPDSYMFHTPNIKLAELQAKAMNLPLLGIATKGEEEKELGELKQLIKYAKEKYELQGIVTGAIASVYQASRVQKICSELSLWCFNPLWQKNQEELLREILKEKYEVIITRVSAYPLDQSFLGKRIDNEMVKTLLEYYKKYKINPAGEGGEFETFVLNCKMFRKKIKIEKFRKEYAHNSGTFFIEHAELVAK